MKRPPALAPKDAFAVEWDKNLGPTGEQNGYQIRPGLFLDSGAMPVPGGVSFTVHSKHATSCELALFRRKESEPFAVFRFPEAYRIGDVFSMIIFGLDIEEFEYAYRLDGPFDPARGYRFDKSKYLLDPYARAVTGSSQWGTPSGQFYKARVVANDFDWGDSCQPHIPLNDLVIYELHVRGFTRHASSGVSYPGTFAGLAEKIPYLNDLGVNAVELMPVFEFDECQGERRLGDNRLLDYWGYNPVCFFAPNTSYAAGVEYNHEGDELKSLIKKLHQNGIEVILDVVFNHTAEGDERGPYISLRGFDNNIYYLLTPEGYYYNFSGCGNTLNCNHPVVQNMILDCLRYWVCEYRVDGFRFDLASILGRNEDGLPMSSPPLLQSLAFDPILGKTKLIAEAWDAGGLYQVGSFPSWNRWSEWNGKYRDDLRRFLKGDAGLAETAANRILGSPDLYDPALRGDSASVNFITCHDGFTLYDLYSYAHKHNENNGWNNTDGDNNNNSWNSGCEGETADPEIRALRLRLMKNAFAVLLGSRGAPMLRAGDEFANTQWGNNNSYCQDNVISWLDWRQLDENDELYSFVRGMICLRRAHPALRGAAIKAECGLPSASAHGQNPWLLDSLPENRVLGALFACGTPEGDDVVFVAMNMHWGTQCMQPPRAPDGYAWRVVADTSQPAGCDLPECAPSELPAVGENLMLAPRSVSILVAIR